MATDFPRVLVEIVNQKSIKCAMANTLPQPLLPTIIRVQADILDDGIVTLDTGQTADEV